MTPDSRDRCSDGIRRMSQASEMTGFNNLVRAGIPPGAKAADGEVRSVQENCNSKEKTHTLTRPPERAVVGFAKGRAGVSWGETQKAEAEVEEEYSRIEAEIQVRDVINDYYIEGRLSAGGSAGGEKPTQPEGGEKTFMGLCATSAPTRLI